MLGTADSHRKAGGGLALFAEASIFAALMPVQYKDYYATLGVPKTATHDEIRKEIGRAHV